MAHTTAGSVRIGEGTRIRNLRGPAVHPVQPKSPARKPAGGPSAPVVGTVSRDASRRGEGLRLTPRGMAFIAAVLCVQFVAAVCLMVVSFFSVSDEPVSPQLGTGVSVSVSGDGVSSGHNR